MTSGDLINLILAAPGLAAGVAFAWVAMELKYLRRDVDRAHKRIEHALEHLERVRELVK